MLRIHEGRQALANRAISRNGRIRAAAKARADQALHDDVGRVNLYATERLPSAYWRAWDADILSGRTTPDAAKKRIDEIAALPAMSEIMAHANVR